MAYDDRCIDGDKYVWKTAAELAGGDPLPPTPPTPNDETGLLQGILDKITRLVEIKEEDVWEPIGNRAPYEVKLLNVLADGAKYDYDLAIPARSMILISDQDITVNLYDVTMNGQDITVQKVSGTADYPIKQLSLWSLPKSRAISKIYITNKGSTAANVQVIVWG